MPRYSLTWVAIFIVVALMFLRLPRMVATQDTVMHTYSALVEVDALAKQQYVAPIEGKRLVDGAIRGMLRQLDPYSGYISPEQLPAFERRNRGDYIGIGVEVGIKEGRLTVIAPIEGGPAIRADIRANDTILSIEGRDAKGLSVIDVEELLTGSPGTAVRLRVQSEGETQARAATIVRGPVSLHTVRGFARHRDGTWSFWVDRERRIAYVRVSSFLSNTLRDFDAVLRRLKTEGMNGLILDLRFDPGGIMQQAIGMVDRFVDHGLILSTVTRRNAVRKFFATQPGTMGRVKLAVLINGSSASSSEIVSGSLQDHRRAIIVGTRSFGKGSMQQLIYLTQSGGAVKLTTAYYRLPKGRIIHRTLGNTPTDDWGIQPTLRVELEPEEEEAIRRSRFELDSVFPDSPQDDTPAMTGEVDSKSAGTLPRQLIVDRQLSAALKALQTP